jgi:hypothetical protein
MPVPRVSEVAVTMASDTRSRGVSAFVAVDDMIAI